MASTTFVDGETLIEATWLNDVNAAVYTPGTQTAADIANVPAGSITATDVQAALNELDGDIQTKQPLDSLLTSLAGQTTAANNVQAYSGVDTATLLSTGTANGNIPLVGTKSATELLAGLVELATQAEAEAGADDTVVMTPLKTKQAVNASGSAPIFACRAWVNFNGTGTVAIRGSGNVSSITDNGTGDYTVNFTTAIDDANYAVNVTARGQLDTDTNSTIGGVGVLTTTSARVYSKNAANALVDSSSVNVSIFR